MIEQAIAQIKKTYPEIIAIYSFGSFGTSYENQESDLDIAILYKEKIANAELWKLAQSIAIKINKNVDLVDLRQASTVSSLQVITKGKLLFCGNKAKCDLFETMSISEYAYLQEQRAPIIQEIKKRGQVY